ncbi:MAG: hypothetical protein KDK36_10575, partial [Leptospiraceae bacterium]|nr:hypothetical protein [Leptospiraceae bacterium]
MKEVFKYLIIFIFALTPVIIFSDSKKAKFLRRLSTAYLIVDLENKVKERDAELNYKPTNEPIKECDKTQIEYREMPWDSAGLYPVLFKDIRIICKKKGDKILFAVGDSITAGLGIKKENTYPFLLTNRFKNTIIINAGISGSNTFHWRRTGILYDRILRQNKEGIDGIIFLLGGNNILFLKHVLKTKAKPSFIVGSIVTLL